MSALSAVIEVVGVLEITVQEMCAKVAASDLVQANQHAVLKIHGFVINVSFESLSL